MSSFALWLLVPWWCFPDGPVGGILLIYDSLREVGP